MHERRRKKFNEEIQKTQERSCEIQEKIQKSLEEIEEKIWELNDNEKLTLDFSQLLLSTKSNLILQSQTQHISSLLEINNYLLTQLIIEQDATQEKLDHLIQRPERGRRK